MLAIHRRSVPRGESTEQRDNSFCNCSPLEERSVHQSVVVHRRGLAREEQSVRDGLCECEPRPRMPCNRDRKTSANVGITPPTACDPSR